MSKNTGGFTIFPQSRVVQLEYFVGITKLGDVFYDFDSRGLLTKVTDAPGHDWTFAYGANEKLSSATDPLGNAYLTASYDGSNRILTYEAATGPWTFDYTAGPSETRVTGADGEFWSYTHETGTGITLVLEEPTLAGWQIQKDTANNPTRLDGPEGWVEQWTWNSAHRPLTYRRGSTRSDNRPWPETGSLPPDCSHRSSPTRLRCRTRLPLGTWRLRSMR